MAKSKKKIYVSVIQYCFLKRHEKESNTDNKLLSDKHLANYLDSALVLIPRKELIRKFRKSREMKSYDNVSRLLIIFNEAKIIINKLLDLYNTKYEDPKFKPTINISMNLIYRSISSSVINETYNFVKQNFEFKKKKG